MANRWFEWASTIKDRCALAAVAAVSTSFAQVNLTGSASVATQKNLAGDKNGLAMTDNTLNVSASEDLGGGMSLKAAFTIENDTTRGAGFTRADQSFMITTSAATFVFANTRSGGAQGAALIAPTNLADDQWTSQVITRSNIDVAYVAIPMGPFGAKISYIEGAGDGAAKPTTASVALGVSYAQGPFTAAANYTNTTPNDATLAALKAAGTDRLTSTDFNLKYDAGVVAIAVGYDGPRRLKAGNDAAATLFGISGNLGQVKLGVNYGKRDTANFMQIGAQYDLSKRTNVNASWGNDNQGTVNAPTLDQYRLSLNHSF